MSVTSRPKSVLDELNLTNAEILKVSKELRLGLGNMDQLPATLAGLFPKNFLYSISLDRRSRQQIIDVLDFLDRGGNTSGS